jgi:hypothetical protein
MSLFRHHKSDRYSVHYKNGRLVQGWQMMPVASPVWVPGDSWSFERSYWFGPVDSNWMPGAIQAVAVAAQDDMSVAEQGGEYSRKQRDPVW